MTRLSERLRRTTRTDATEPEASSFARQVTPQLLARDDQPVTRRLYERLDEDVVAEVERGATESGDLATLGLDVHDPDVHQWAVLHLGMWLRSPGVAEQTGLSAAHPPEAIHTMARGPLAAAGGLYEADLVVAALASAGVTLGGCDALDFGCSSGRVVRVLAAAFPGIRWLGCDPNRPAIEWATANLPGIEFFASEGEPPLPLDESSLDFAFAISIWSHFEPSLGLRWFDEMHRIVRPGGHLVFTTHGLTTVTHEESTGRRGSVQLGQIVQDLYRQGWWYAPEFGKHGDWGVVNPGWGTAFLSPEWVMTELCPRWRVVEFAPGREQSNQDVYVLERA